VKQELLLVKIGDELSASAVELVLLSWVALVEKVAPFLEVAFKFVILSFVLTVVNRRLQDVAFFGRLIVLFVQDNVPVALKVLVPKMTHHLGSSLAPKMLKITLARLNNRVAVALRLEIVLALRNVRLTNALFQSILANDDVPFSGEDLDLE
jgi:hypothetical protein